MTFLCVVLRSPPGHRMETLTVPDQGEEGKTEDTLGSHLLDRLFHPYAQERARVKPESFRQDCRALRFPRMTRIKPSSPARGGSLKPVPGAPSAGLPGSAASALPSWEVSRGLGTGDKGTQDSLPLGFTATPSPGAWLLTRIGYSLFRPMTLRAPGIPAAPLCSPPCLRASGHQIPS